MGIETSLLIDYLVPFGMVTFFAMAAGMINASYQFNSSIFMLSLAIGIAILVWCDAIDVFFVSISAIILVGVVFRNNNDGV